MREERLRAYRRSDVIAANRKLRLAASTSNMFIIEPGRANGKRRTPACLVACVEKSGIPVHQRCYANRVEPKTISAPGMPRGDPDRAECAHRDSFSSFQSMLAYSMLAYSIKEDVMEADQQHTTAQQRPSTPITYAGFETYVDAWQNAAPFNHLVLENFLQQDIAQAVASEFPAFESEDWRIYNNAIEVKKLLNHWDKFGPATYRLFEYLNSPAFLRKLEPLVGCTLFPDFGLNGGGLHTHKRGGKLNTHLDYSIHPKLQLERRLNLLIYITPDWQEEWGGLLGLWEKHPDKDAPGELVRTIVPTFNTAVLFDTTQNSWHGLPEPIVCPEHITRNSLAVYYLCEPRERADTRGKALFAPYKEQADDPQVLELIKMRANVNQSKNVYGDKP
jgi:Rps23 Pro-64 3,4-dihydroxylase Tpa1-like proline 4-hydroxylase